MRANLLQPAVVDTAVAFGRVRLARVRHTYRCALRARRRWLSRHFLGLPRRRCLASSNVSHFRSATPAHKARENVL